MTRGMEYAAGGPGAGAAQTRLREDGSPSAGAMIDGRRALPVPEESRPVGGAPRRPLTAHRNRAERAGSEGSPRGPARAASPRGLSPPSDIAPPHARPHERFFLSVCFADIWGLFYF